MKKIEVTYVEQVDVLSVNLIQSEAGVTHLGYVPF